MQRFAVLLVVAIAAGCGSGVQTGATPPSQLVALREGRETAAARRRICVYVSQCDVLRVSGL